MIWNGVSNEERLHLWKNLRDELKGENIDIQLEKIAKFYATVPYGARTLDYYDPSNWPTPWEILFHGSFCTSSISLLIYYTFQLVSSDHKIDLYLVDDNGDVYLLPVINDQYVLNYELGSISKLLDIKDDVKVLQVFSKNQIKTIT